ncbi:serine hydrolase [Nocardioides agariphilus]|jgi:beta-lactamase class A|uniref:Serine hydrolase n=1 Tax=Nocardioides agariphilus TaxID=433664 RepID=A0A930VHR4_9ACTN|nr:serine hydrolase [Nocardioides agariphilus]MBF4767769.1 serine hydrolase [Nocardioides agariphilus]
MALADDVIAIWDHELAGVEAWSLVLRWRDLDVDVRGDLAYSGASTIKTFLLEQASTRLAWDQPVTVTSEHLAEGDGVLKSWPLPVTVPLHAVAQLMTALSDNTATNAVVDTLGGLEVVNDALAAAGGSSRMRRWVTGRHSDPRCDSWDASPALPSRAGLSVVVPREHADAVSRMVSSPSHAVARAMLEQQWHRDSLARHLVDETPFAHKSGSVGGVRHDGGVLLPGSQDAVVVHCFTDGPERDELLDDVAAVGMGRALARTLRLLGLGHLVAPVA